MNVSKEVYLNAAPKPPEISCLRDRYENNTKQIYQQKSKSFIGIFLNDSSATFITNGVERVVVNQMHRSPGVFLDHDKENPR